jgi:endonuclease III
VLVRIRLGQERENYGRNYKEAQKIIEIETPATFDARIRAFLLLKSHGQQLCKRADPKCDRCPVAFSCAFLGGGMRGRSAPRVP